MLTYDFQISPWAPSIFFQKCMVGGFSLKIKDGLKWFRQFLRTYNILVTLHEKPYFPGSGISWKAQKDQTNITFTSPFWLKKRSYSNKRKAQNKNFLVAENMNFSVISKYHLFINFLSQKRLHFPSWKSSKQELFINW